jgi:hypothetical protein
MKTNTKILMLLIGFAAVLSNLKGNAQTAIEVCANADEFTITFDTQILPAYMRDGGNGQPLSYSLSFSPQVPSSHSATHSRLPNMSGTFTGTSTQKFIIVQIPDNAYPNHYTGNIILTNTISNCTYTLPVKVDVLYSSLIMEQKWCNTVGLLNHYYNGGFMFSAYQWYKNGQIMNGETHSYIYAGDGNLFEIGEKYSVLVTRSNDGVSIMSCPITIKQRQDAQGNNQCK